MSGSLLRCALVGGAVMLPSLMAAQGPASHSSNVWSATFARNDSSVMTVARGEVRIWALPSGQLACRLDGNHYYGGIVRTDGERGYHVTFVGADSRATRAITVDAASCAQRPAANAATRFEDRGRESVGTRLITETMDGANVRLRTPTGTTLEAGRNPSTLEVGDTWYVCTMTEKGKIVYYRMVGSARAEKIGDIDRHNMKGCGPLTLSADSTMLLNAGAGSAVDLRSKRVIVSAGASQPTSVGIDAARRQLIVGHGSGISFVT